MIKSNLPMDAKTYLVNYAKKADRFLDEFFTKEKKAAAKISPICAQMMDIYRDYMRGGKKLRGALTVLGYRCAGGKDEKISLPASVAVEMLHSFLLMHDDFIDHDLTRRGGSTVHVQYAQIFSKKRWKGDAQHYGAGMAIILGDVGVFLAHKILSGLPTDSKNKAQTISRLADCLLKTAYGEALDVTYDHVKDFSSDEILRIRKLKTAYYTLVMPLVVGASLAGGNEKLIADLESYGLPVGIAFQLKDDYLGVFGGEKKTGKSAQTDLVEGKKTILILKALENLRGKEKKLLLSVFGNRNALDQDIKQTKQLIRKSGAVNFFEKKAKDLIKEGKNFVPKITPDFELRGILYNFANFIIKREK